MSGTFGRWVHRPVTIERRSGYLLAARLPRISAELTKAAMIRLLKLRRSAVQPITLDNGRNSPVGPISEEKSKAREGLSKSILQFSEEASLQVWVKVWVKKIQTKKKPLKSAA